MKTGTDWTDLAYFSAVARLGGLARAAGVLGVSAATLSRRMKAFEARLGRRLFLHGAEGYALTPDGRALMERTRGMDEIARQVDMWCDAARGPVCVRISAGTWTMLDLAENLPELWSAGDPWLPEFIYCDFDLDIARREIDIGIRNRRPDQPWVARQHITRVKFAVYGAHDRVDGWIGSAWESAETPSMRWIEGRHGGNIVTRANNPHVAVALARAGIGRVVLPTFVGRGMTGLTRLSDPIEELESDQWLVSHHDARNEPPIRAALDAIAAYLKRRG
ncbi:MAG: LysR family transcriptional regulator [Pseudomonadota bacterium]